MANQVNAQAMTPNQLAALFAANPSFLAALVAAIGPLNAQTIATVAANGTGQSSATLLTAATNILVSGSGGVILKSGSTNATIINRTTQMVLIYPPLGQQIETNAANAPVEIAVGGSANFVYGSGTWFAY